MYASCSNSCVNWQGVVSQASNFPNLAHQSWAKSKMRDMLLPGWDREISCGTVPPDAGQLAGLIICFTFKNKDFNYYYYYYYYYYIVTTHTVLLVSLV